MERLVEEPPSPFEPDAVAGPDWTRDAIIRVARSRFTFERERQDDLLAVLPEGVVFARKRRDTPAPNVDELRFETLEIRDRLARASTRRLRWDEIDRVECSYRCEVGFMRRRYRRIGRDLCIQPTAGPAVRMFLPYDDASRVLDAARFHLGDRVVEDVEPFGERRLEGRWKFLEILGTVVIPFAGAVLALILAIILVAAVAFDWFRAVPDAAGRRGRRRLAWTASLGMLPLVAVAVAVLGGAISSTNRVFGFEFLWIMLAAMLVGTVLTPIAVSRLRPTLLAYPRERLDRCPERPVPTTHWFERLCGLWPRPLRNRWVSRGLRVVGGIVLVASFVPGSFLDRIPALTVALATAVVYLGYRIGSESASSRLRRDGRPPIVFLRSFRDDGRGSFNRSDWRASVLGIQAMQTLQFLGPLANSNPIRVVRLLLGRGGDTAEEQLDGYLRRHGPFIAIGRPQEGLPTGGAARDYVPDDVWHERVEAWMGQARMIVIQPGASSGIWWEIDRALATIPRDRLLFSLLPFDGRDDEHESFALRVRANLGVDLPLYRGDTMFLAFDGDRPVRIAQRTRTPFAWPMSGCTADLPAMLGPRFGTPEVAPPPLGWRPGRWRFDLAVIAAWLLWLIPLFAVQFLVILANEDIRARFGPSPFGESPRRLSWAGLSWEGGDRFTPSRVPQMAFEVPGASIGGLWLPDVATDPQAELLDFGQMLLGPYARDPVRRTVMAQGIEWSEHRFPEVPTRFGMIESVLRAADVGDGFALHWAIREIDAGMHLGPALEALIDSVRIVGFPVEGVDFTFATDEGWIRRPDPKPGSHEFVTPSGDRWGLQLESAPTRLDTNALEQVLQESLRVSREGIEVVSIGPPPRDRPLAADSFETLLVTGEANGAYQTLFRIIQRNGWFYRIYAVSSRADVAPAEFQRLADSVAIH